MLSRPSDTGHTPFGDIFVSESPDLVHWGRHRHVIGRGGPWWQGTKIGAGPSPIETSEGWLLFYHGVTTTCNGYVYSIGAMLLDLDEPWKVIACAKEPLIVPEATYELTGFVPGCLFPRGLPLRCGDRQDCDLLRRGGHLHRALLLQRSGDRGIHPEESAETLERAGAPALRALAYRLGWLHLRGREEAPCAADFPYPIRGEHGDAERDSPF